MHVENIDMRLICRQSIRCLAMKDFPTLTERLTAGLDRRLCKLAKPVLCLLRKAMGEI